MKKSFFGAVIVIAGFMQVVTLSAAGSRQQDAASAGGVSTIQVTPRPLSIDPCFGEAAFYAQPATSYTTNPQYPAQPAVSNKNGFPIVQNKITLRLATPYYSYVQDYEDNDMTRYMEGLTNIKIEWELLPETNPLEKVNLMFAAGDQLPDFFFWTGFPNNMLITLGASKMIIPLQDLIEKHGFNMQALFTERPIVKAGMISADGNIYALSGFSVNEANQMAKRMWVNQTFLDKLNMKAPTTTEEFYQYLKAVKTRDPNGNGRADEIPLIGSTDGWHSNIDAFLMNSFIFDDATENSNPINRRRLYLTDDGIVDAAFNKPQWREGLRYLRRLCAEDLLASESFTIKQGDMRNLVEDNPMKVGAVAAGGPHVFATTTGERRKDYICIPPLKGPEGVQLGWWDEFAGPETGQFVITKDSKYPEAAIKWVDYCYNGDFRMRNRLGVPNRDWRVPPPGTMAVDGADAIYEEILKWGTPQKSYWGRGNFWTHWTTTKTARTGDPWELDLRLWNALLEYRPYRFERMVPRNMPFSVEDARRYTELNTAIIEYVEQAMAGFVTGTLNIDRDWDTYLANLDRLGLKEFLQITQTGFNKTWKDTLGYPRRGRLTQ